MERIGKVWFIVSAEKNYATDKIEVYAVTPATAGEMLVAYDAGHKVVSGDDELHAFIRASEGKYLEKGKRINGQV